VFVCYLTNGSTVLAQYRHVTDGRREYLYIWC